MVMNLQFFGGRGGTSGLSGNKSSNKGNIVAFSNKVEKDTSNDSGWDYRGESERVDKLIKNANEAKSVNQINSAALSLKREDEHISALIKNVQADNGDVNALLTLRRKIRVQRRKTKL